MIWLRKWKIRNIATQQFFLSPTNNRASGKKIWILIGLHQDESKERDEKAKERDVVHVIRADQRTRSRREGTWIVLEATKLRVEHSKPIRLTKFRSRLVDRVQRPSSVVSILAVVIDVVAILFTDGCLRLHKVQQWTKWSKAIYRTEKEFNRKIFRTFLIKKISTTFKEKKKKQKRRTRPKFASK